MSEIIAAIVVSVLASSLLTSLGFISMYNGKLKTIQANSKSMKESLDMIQTDVREICEKHNGMSNMLSRHDERIKTLESR